MILVLADRHVRERVEARFVGDRLALDARADVDERDVNARKHGSGRVLHHAGNLCRVELRVRGRRAQPTTHRQQGRCASS